MPTDKPLVWLAGKVKTPPFSAAARLEAGMLLRRLQRGEALVMPQARRMSVIGPRCAEVRITDENRIWRIMVRTDTDAVLILHVFNKKTETTPPEVIALCKRRLRDYDNASKGRPQT